MSKQDQMMQNAMNAEARARRMWMDDSVSAQDKMQAVWEAKVARDQSDNMERV